MTVVLAHLRKTASYVQESFVPNLTGTFIRVWTPIAKKCEGTFVERAGLFLKGVYVDYREVITDTVTSVKKKPRKIGYYTGVAGILAGCAAVNPDAASFRDAVLSWQLKVILVGESTRRPDSVMQLRSIETWYNEGRVRFLSVGIMSFVWLHDYDEDSALYHTQCKFLKPTWASYPSRVLDIGFLGKWWILEKYMVDYDINEEEFMPSKID